MTTDFGMNGALSASFVKSAAFHVTSPSTALPSHRTQDLRLVAYHSLSQSPMRHRNLFDRRCSYVVVLDGDCGGDLRELAAYLSTLGVAKCEVIVVDGSSEHTFHRNRRVLCWVSRHVAARTRFRDAAGSIDPVRAAIDLASCEKIVVADSNVRYSTEALDQLCAMLDAHQAVEPQDYIEPLPWWSGIEAGRMLVHRGIEPMPDHGATFGFRKSAARGLRAADHGWAGSDDPVRRLAAQGVEVISACGVFVRRFPPMLTHWLDERPRQADDDFSFPVKTAFFFALIPLAVLLATLGGVRLAGGYAGAVGFAAFMLAVRGRIGAAQFFPLRACLYAPLWVLERSVSVYWALLRKVTGSKFIPRREAPEDLEPMRAAHKGA